MLDLTKGKVSPIYLYNKALGSRMSLPLCYLVG